MDDEWIPLRDYMENPLVKDIWLYIERQMMYAETRRTVYVTTRKYRARRKRRS